MKVNGLKELYRFPGWKIDSIDINPDLTTVRLSRDGRALLECPHCRERMTPSRKQWRIAKDLPLGMCRVVELCYEAVQCRCRFCDTYSTIVPDCIGHHGRATYRFKRFVSQLCRHLPANQVKEFLPISTGTAISYDKEILSSELPEPCLDGIRTLLIDEKFIGRQHNFVTVVLNGDTGELLHMALGKKKESLESFFDKLTDEQLSSIEAVGIDRSGAYSAVVKERIPKAAIVWDKFHIVANFNEAIDDIRREAWRAAKEADKAFIKGQRYNLLRLWENNSIEQRYRLRQLLDVNEDLSIAYILSAALRQVWMYKYRKSAEKYLDSWIAWAWESGVKQLIDFASKIMKAKDGILNFCRHKITTGRLEGFNNLISRVIHRSCGVKDFRYLFLKLRQISLG